MDTKPLLVMGWFGASITTLAISLILLLYLSTTIVVKSASHNFQLYAALPDTSGQISDTINRKDARAKIIEDFFKGYNSSLADLSDVFIKTADDNKLDWRLLPAISMQESNGGKRVIQDSFNPFGYGIYGDKVLRFSSWEEAIKTVGAGLRKNYLDLGLNTPEKIMAKYTPPSLAKDGAWAKGVNSFMLELQ